MLKEFKQLSKNLISKFYFDYNLSSSTWFRTGGKADVFCIVANEKELEIILNHLDDYSAIFVIGAGSNVLIRDGGFKGIIIKLGKSFNELNYSNNYISSGAGILDVNLSKFAYLNSVCNLEFFSGIPGTIGGAIKMNAGCFGSETKDVVKEISIISKHGLKKNISKDQLDFSYRESNLSNHDIVTSVVFSAKTGEKNEIEANMKKIRLMRENSQPLRNKTSGSTFKNPKKHYAAQLIENADCKGLRYGEAIVSTKHANFLINLGNANSNDIETLGKIVQERVMNKFSIALEWEIKIIGEKAE